jgi:hypothetical protein
MRKHKFIIELEFDQKIVDDLDINKISDNIARSLYNEVQTGIGLVPEDSDNYTKLIKVGNFITEHESKIII